MALNTRRGSTLLSGARVDAKGSTNFASLLKKSWRELPGTEEMKGFRAFLETQMTEFEDKNRGQPVPVESAEKSFNRTYREAQRLIQKADIRAQHVYITIVSQGQPHNIDISHQRVLGTDYGVHYQAVLTGYGVGLSGFASWSRSKFIEAQSAGNLGQRQSNNGPVSRVNPPKTPAKSRVLRNAIPTPPATPRNRLPWRPPGASPVYASPTRNVHTISRDIQRKQVNLRLLEMINAAIPSSEAKRHVPGKREMWDGPSGILQTYGLKVDVPDGWDLRMVSGGSRPDGVFRSAPDLQRLYEELDRTDCRIRIYREPESEEVDPGAGV